MQNSPRLQSPLTKWLAGIAFWTLVGLFFSIHAYYYFSAQQPGYTFLDALKGTLPQWYVWGLLAGLIVRLDHALGLRQMNIVKRALIHFPLSIFWTILYVFLETFSDQLVYGAMQPLNVSYVAGDFQWNLPNYWFIVSAYLAYEYYREYRDRELKATQLEAQLAKAHLQSLKAQLRPHFLFNALNTISAHMESDPKTARRMAAHLGDLLRFSLQECDKLEITVAEEISLLEQYLEIQRVRFEDRLQVTMNIAPETRKALVPTLLTQPLVENSIRHGLSSKPTGGSIEVRTERKNGKLHLQVIDDGIGLPPGWNEATSKGFGLLNTIEMLSQLYSGKHHFEIRNRPEGGVAVNITLPFRSEEEAH